jgi:RNA polymerase sigma factor (sigma-70 family)
MGADPPGGTRGGSSAADVLAGYLSLIRQAVARAASRRAAPFQDDIAQNVVTEVWRQLEREQPIERPASYVYRAVIRETVRWLHRQEGRREVSLDSPAVDVPAAGVDPHGALEAHEMGTAIETCLQDLAPDRARAVRAHLAGFEVAEMMRMYGWTYQRARNLVARGMGDLRTALRSRGVTP